MKAAPRSGRVHRSFSGAGKAWAMTSSGWPLASATQANSCAHAAAEAGVIAYMRALATRVMSVFRSGVAQAVADVQPVGFFQHGMAKRDIGQRQAAMPEQDGLVVAFAAGRDRESTRLN